MTILYKQAVILFGGVLIIGWLCSIHKPFFAMIMGILMFALLEYNRRKMKREEKTEPDVTS